jgi:ATP-dependent helicase HepA
MNPHPVKGQRYVCDADPDLGLGLVTEVSARTLTLHFPATGTTRQFAISNSPLTRIRFEPGDSVLDLQGQSHRVLAVTEQDGLLSYEAMRPDARPVRLRENELSPLLSLGQPLKRLLAAQTETTAWFKLRRKALETLGDIESSPLLGLCSGRTELLPHQLYIAHEVARRPAPRVLLSDEVGLGKTIEACLILQQQLFSGLASRVLVVVPDSLLHQWLVELLRRFNLRFTILDAERCAALTEHDSGNPFESEQLLLCSRDFLATEARWLDAALAAPWDLLILDEAHHLLSAQDSDRTTALYQLASRLAAHIPGVLLLTATPDQEGLASHFALLRLLDPGRFHDYAAFVAGQQHYQALAALLDPLQDLAALEPAQRAALLDALQAFASDTELRQLLDTLRTASKAETPALGEKLLAALLDRHGTGRIVFRNTRRHVSGFPRRRLNLQYFPLPLLYAADAMQLHPELAWLKHTEWLREDPRVAWVHELLRQHPRDKFLLICHSRATAEALEQHLNLGKGIRSAVFHEGLSLLERDRAAAWFAESDGGAQLLVCSEIGSEGRNFQFSRHLILFDLPANPDLLEQRIGRLDRIGQQHDVLLHVPCFEQSAQSVLLELYDKVFDIFREPNPVAAHVCAALAPLLASTLAAPGDVLLRQQLLQQAASHNSAELQRHAQGRDRLLELNSCRPAQARVLVETLQALETADSPAALLQDVFSAYGLDYDINSNGTWNVRPGDDMLLSDFPQIPDDGMTFTLQRDLAVVRDDLPFVNWLHPLVQQSLDLVLQEHQGKACVALLRDKRLPSGSLVLEAVFRVSVSAPARLQAKRWFPVTTLRAVVDTQKRSLARSLAASFIDERCEALDKAQVRSVVTEWRVVIEQLQQLCLKTAMQQLPALVADRTQHMLDDLATETARLRALQQVNTQVADAEITYLEQQQAQLSACYASASLQLSALRLLVVA